MAWVVIQVADAVLNNVTGPAWVFHVLLLFLAIGLPFALFYAWAFEIAPEGIMRESEVDRSQSITPQTGKKLNLMITAALLQPHCPKKRINLDCKIRLLQLVIISTLLGGGAAIANVLEEVTVTAQKREQNSQDVGIAMTVMTGDFTR